MNSGSWEKDPFQGSETEGVGKAEQSNWWEDEDDDEDVVDSWDQEPEEEDKGEETEKAEPPPKSEKQPPAKDVEEKGAIQKKNHVDPVPKEAPKSNPETEVDLEKELLESVGSLESQEDYDKLKEKMMKVISDANKNANFVSFSEEVIHGLCTYLPSQDLRRLQTWVGNLQIEKSKMEKGDKPKKNKGKGKVKLKLEGDHDFNADYYGEEYDDFM